MRFLLLLGIIGMCVASVFLFAKSNKVPIISDTLVQEIVPIAPLPTSEPDIPFVRYEAPKLQKKTAYRIILLGDSMTAALGPYADKLREVVKETYTDRDLIIENRSAPSSNVASLQDRLLSTSTQTDVDYEPILGKDFDIIVIESFGYNPLSHLGLAEGIDKANESLLNAMRILVREQPNALVIFLATVAPSHTMYGVGAVDLTPAVRDQWASERDAYIENHIAFAQEHNIPIVDVYHLTKSKTGDGMLKYINLTDHIHPSQVGVNFIQEQLAAYFIDNKIFE
jgi:hypothetical protein